MKVFVIGLNNRPLMPTTPRKARILLREKKATIIKKVPFTIKLNYKTGSATQKGYLGVDTGSQHIGISVVRENVEGNYTVLSKTEYALRTTMKKRSLIETRASLRRGQRFRHLIDILNGIFIGNEFMLKRR